MKVPAALRRLIERREDSLAIQSIMLTGARVLGFIITFAIPLVLVRVFSQASFGAYKQLFLIAGTAVPILNLGMYASVFYFVPRDENGGGRYLAQAIGLLSLSGGLAAVALTLWAEPIAGFFETPALAEYMPLLGLFVLLSTPSELVTSIPVIDRRSMLAAYTMTGSDLLRATGIILAALIWRSITAVVWAAVAVAFLRAVWLLAYMRLRRMPGAGVDRSTRHDLSLQLRYALPFAAAVIFQIGLTRFHEYYVAANVSAEQFAIYAVGILHIPVVGMLVQSIVEVMLVRVAQAHKQNDIAEMRRLWRAALERLGTVLIPAFAISQLVAPDLIRFLFGAEYAAAVPVFRVFLFLVPMLIIVDHGILRATGDTGYVLVANAVGLAISVVAVLVLAERSLLLGAVAGYLTGLFAMRALGLRRVAGWLKLPWWRTLPWSSLARTSAASILSVLLASLSLALPHPFLRIAAAGVLFSLVYSGLTFWWELVPREEIRAVLRRFSPIPVRAGS